MTKFKKVIAMILALLMTFSSVSVLASAWDVDELVNTKLSIRTEFLKEVGGEWVVTEKVIPGQSVKARVYVGTNYYSNDSELLFHYDDSFFDVAFEDGEIYDLEGVNSEAGVSAMLMNFADEKAFGVLVSRGSVYNAVYNSSTWLFDIPLTVKSTASGSGRIYVDENDVRNTDNQEGYINVPAGPEGGSSENYSQVISMNHWDVDSIELDNPYVTINTKLVFHSNVKKSGDGFTTGDAATYETTGVIGTTITPAIPQPVKDGYAFRGWTEEADVLPYSATPTVYPEDDGEFYAYWDKKVDYIFDAGEGNYDGESTKTFAGLVPDADFTAPADPVRDGYTFRGYDKEVPSKVGYAVSDEDYTVTFTAIWAKNVTARFMDGENVLYTFNGYAGQEFDEVVENPSKPGFYFADWSPAMPTVFPDDSTDYVAQWDERTFTVNYFVDGEFRGSAQVGYNEEVNFNYPSAKADYGYELSAWHLGSESGTVIADGYRMPGNNINIYSTQTILKNLPAVFKKDASDTEAYATTYADFDENISVPANNPQKPGYNFIGWEPQVGTMDNVNGKTFIAAWEPADVNVSFYAYNDSGEYELYDSFGVENGQNLDVPADPYMDGYTFKGWATAQGQTTGASAEEIEEIVMGTTELSFYEARTANTYKVNFAVDGGTSVTTPQTVTYGNDIILPETSKTGYKFEGWKDEGGVTHTDNYKVPALENDGDEMTLTAQWSINQYKIIFEDYNGSVIKTVTKDYNTEILNSDIPTQPTREGYYFTEWTEIPSRMPISENGTIVTAQYEIEQYTYEFDTLGGSAVTSITKKYGEAIEAPSSPTKEGNAFQYWYITNDSTPFTFGTTMPDLGEDGAVVTVKAKWSVNDYTITFNSNDGSSVTPITKKFNENISKPDDPTKEGFTFSYWYETDENTPYIFSKMPAKSFTLNAKWENASGISYQIVINTMGTDGEYAPDTRNCKGVTGDEIKFDDVKPTLGAGFEFSKTTVSDTTKTVSPDGTTVFNIYVDRIKYKFTAKVDGNTTKEEDVYYGAMLPQPTTPSKTGHSFSYWYETEGVSFDVATETMPAKALTINAKFTPETYANGVKFNANTGAFNDSTTEKSVTATFGQQFNAPLAPTKKGYTFMGWAASDEPNAEVVAAPGAKLPALAVDLDDNELTYFAVWEAETYTDGVVFKANSGEFADKSTEKTVTATFGQTFNAPEEPTRSGYDFAGWATSSATGAEIIAAPGVALPALAVDLDTDDLIYFAVWEPETYTNGVSFNANGGKFADEKETANVSATFGQEIVPPTAPTKTGFTFAGWTAEGSDAIVAIPGSNLPALAVDLDDTTLTYFAKWNNASGTPYTVTVYTMGADGEYDEGVSDTTRTGTTGSTVRFDDVKPVLGDGFKFGTHDVGNEITPDGQMVFNIYVDRETYTATFTDGEEFSEEVDALYGATFEAPEAPEKTGKVFNKWVDAEGAEPSTMPLNGATYTSVYENRTYTINYFVDDEFAGSTSIEYGSVIPTVCATYDLEPGYALNGWYKESIEGEKLGKDETISDNMNLYATTSAIEYKVTFNANGGKFEDLTEVKETTASLEKYEIVAPESPTRKGYFFAGWSPEVGDFSQPGDKTYMAIWDIDPEGFILKFMILKDESKPDLGYEEYESLPLGVGDNMEAPADPDVTGYTFLGWSSEEGVTTNLLSDEDISELVMGENDETFYAVFEINKYDIAYNVYTMNLSGEYGDAEPTTSEDVAYGTVLNATDFDVPDGFTLDTQKSTSSVTVEDGTEVMNIYLSRNKYKLNFFLYEDDATPAYFEDVYYGAEIKVPGSSKNQQLIAASTDDATKYGKKIVSWFVEDDLEEMPAKNVKVVAGLEDKIFTITFVKRVYNFFGGYTDTIDPQNGTYNAVYGEKIDETYLSDAYDIELGYDEIADKSTTLPFTIDKNSADEITVYVASKKHVSTIRFFLDDDQYEAYLIGKADPIAKYDLEFETVLDDYVPDLTGAKKGYTHIGWDVDPIMVDEFDAEYIAQWKANEYTYNFMISGESTPHATGKAEYDSDISAVVPSNPTAPEGYYFKGWSKVEGGKTTVKKYGKISTDVSENTFYAVFEELSSTTVNVTFYEYDGTNVHGPATGTIKEVIIGAECAEQYGEISVVEIGSALVLPTAPELANYTFAGWFDVNGKQWNAGDAVPNADLALYAKYVRVQCGLVAAKDSTTVIERGAGKLNNLDDVASYTDGCYWYVYGLRDRLKEADLLSKYITVSGDCSITVEHPLSKNYVGTASTITVTDNVSGEVVEKFYIIIFGDVDGNGSITTNDVSICKDEQLGITRWSKSTSATYDPIVYKAANVDGSRLIGSTDIAIITDKVLTVNDIDQVTGLAKEK